MSMTPSKGWERLDKVGRLCISFSMRNSAVTLWRESFALLLWANAYTWPTSNTWRAGDRISRTARRCTPEARAPRARLRAIPTFARSTEHRMTCSRSSTPATFSCLYECQSTTLSRFPATASATFTPSFARDSRYCSGDWDEIATTTASPARSPSARNWRANRSFSVPEGPWRTTLAPPGRPPPTIGSKPSTPVGMRTSDHLLVRGDDQAGGRDVHRMLRRVVFRKPHLPDGQGPAEFPLHVFKAEVDEGVRDELLDPVAGESMRVYGLGDQNSRDILAAQEAREREESFAVFSRGRIVESDRGQGVDHEPPHPGGLQGRGEEVLELAEPDRGAFRTRDPQLPEVDHQEPLGPLEVLVPHAERPHHPHEARLRLLQDEVHRGLPEPPRAVVREVEGEQALPAPRGPRDEIHGVGGEPALDEEVESLDARREALVHRYPSKTLRRP